MNTLRRVIDYLFMKAGYLLVLSMGGGMAGALVVLVNANAVSAGKIYVIIASHLFTAIFFFFVGKGKL